MRKTIAKYEIFYFIDLIENSTQYSILLTYKIMKVEDTYTYLFETTAYKIYLNISSKYQLQW